jgi:hypothetical protein
MAFADGCGRAVGCNAWLEINNSLGGEVDGQAGLEN